MLEGRFVSPSAEPLQNPDGSMAYLIRDFTFSGSNWKLLLTAYGDPAQSVKLFEATVEGKYSLGKESIAATEAVEADFSFEKVTMTPFIEPLVAMFNESKSGHGNWKIGDSQDVSQTGCMFFRPVGEYGMEYDLVKLDGSKLYLGERPADNNMGSVELRPKSLTKNPVVRR